ALERTLKHPFRDPGLLEQAVTHSSLAFEQSTQDKGLPPDRKKNGGSAQPHTATDNSAGKAPADNEKLEFLGDAVLGLVVAQSLYESFPDLAEGDLTRIRAALVSRRHLSKVAESLELGRYLRLGRGEERNGGRTKAVLLANCFEAVLAALYLDAGIEAARVFVQQTVIEPTAHRLYKGLEHGDSMGDHKSALQELLQAHGSAPPEYEVKAESGPDHRKRFLVEVTVPGSAELPQVQAQGQGTTKKRAEQEAARVACLHLREPALAAEANAIEVNPSGAPIVQGERNPAQESRRQKSAARKSATA
ncbi:MAG: Ribonuclease, partial [Acidobacteriaceae bacterium]|nr:Ribonuclease [Acidobacteriaceae bacterium]